MSSHQQLDPDDAHPLRNHGDCRTLTGLVYDSLPSDRTLGRVHRYSKGEMLWTFDESRHDVYFLKRGQIAILLNDSAGCEVIVRVIKPGELFGELCFCSMRDRPRENCAQAVVDSEAVQIDFPAFLAHLRRDLGTLEAFTFTICKRLADAENRIEVLSHRGAEVRLGRLLLQLAGSRESSHGEAEVKLPIGHDELARMAAMTRPHVSVTMSKLRGRGLVQYDRGRQLTVNVAHLGKYLDQGKMPSDE